MTIPIEDFRAAGSAWSRHPGLIGVFVAVQLCIGLKYLDVGFHQAQDRMHGQRVLSPACSDGDENDRRVHGGFPLPWGGRFLAGSFQRDFEAAARKHFPSAEAGLIPWYCGLSMHLSNASLVQGTRPRTAPAPIWGEFALIWDGQGERICGRPAFYRETDRRKLADRSDYYNRLHATWPRVRFHVFPVLSTADWCAVEGLYGAGAMRQLVGDRYARELRARLDPGIGCAWEVEGETSRDAISHHYRTDHHWSFPGAYQVYCQLWRLLHQQNQRLGPPVQVRGCVKVPNVVFYGSLAHRAGCYDAFGDEIVDAVLDLPKQEVQVYGFEGKERNGKRQYWAGHYDRTEFANHYEGYFGGDYGLIEYKTAGARGGGLLVISDSYDNCLEPLLASHFRQSWFVDLRLYAKDVGEEFDMDDFLTRHEVTDVLFVGGQGWVLGFQSIGPYESQ